MKLVCIINAHEPFHGDLLVNSAERAGVEIVKFGERKSWPQNFVAGKLIDGLECVKALPADVTHVMFLDNSDSLLLAGTSEILTKFERSCEPGQILIQAEKNLYPFKQMEEQYESKRVAKSPWKYVNSGGWIGRRADVEAILPHVIQNHHFCDQVAWHREYLRDNPAITQRPVLDEGCEIFQSMFLQSPEELVMIGDRMNNRFTGSAPSVVHWNGTRNAGDPYSRDGVWQLIEQASNPDARRVPTICVCIPGERPSSMMWVVHFAELYQNLVRFFGPVRLVSAWGNNIYQVRENCLKEAAKMLPDFLLWIDSDNPPAVQNFGYLWSAINATPAVSCVGGWYRFGNFETGEVFIAAGKMGERFKNITEEEILESSNLIQVPFIGFGMCLMRWKVIEDIGVEKCFEPYMFSPEDQRLSGRTWATDDAGFFRRATEAGHKIFLHPAVFLEHEKQMNVPASLERFAEKPVLKEL